MVPQCSLDRLLSWYLDPIPPDQSSCLPLPMPVPHVTRIRTSHVPVPLQSGPSSLLLHRLCYPLECLLLQVLPGANAAWPVGSARMHKHLWPKEVEGGRQKRGQGLWGQVCDFRASHQLSEPVSAKWEYSIELLMRFRDGICEGPGKHSYRCGETPSPLVKSGKDPLVLATQEAVTSLPPEPPILTASLLWPHH